MENGTTEQRRRFYNLRLTDPDSHPESLWMVTWKDFGLGYMNTNSTHGLNPAISRAIGSCKLVFWIVLFLGALSGLGIHFYAMTSTFLAYDVLVKTTLSHVREMDFPAVTVCNMNPIKRSLLLNNPRLEALVASWGVGDNSRKKRDTGENVSHGRTRRSTTLPELTECPGDALLRYGAYCYSVFTESLTWDSAQARCEVGGGNLVWFDSEQEHDVITQLYCQIETCTGNKRFWIGLYDTVGDDVIEDHRFSWGGTPTYFNWNGDGPISTEHRCVIDRRYAGTSLWEWTDQSCSTSKDYLCKYRVAEQTDVTMVTETHVTACEGETTSLVCQDGQTVHIVSVFYGRNDSNVCPTDAGSSADCECDTNDGCSISVLQACESMTSCDVNATDDFIRVDPCEDVSKYLTIRYSCWTLSTEISPTENSSETTTQTTIDTTHTVTSGLREQAATDIEQTATSTSDIAVTTSIATTDSNMADPDPAQESVYEDRDPYREDFLQENDFFRILADISVEEKQQMGYNVTDLITECTFLGMRCRIEIDRNNLNALRRKKRSSSNQWESLEGNKFSQFFDGTHGNCYIFNSGWDMNSILKTSQTGRKNGLRLVLSLGQEDYVPQIGEAAGVVVVVHPQERFPFPEDEGILALPGHITSIGVREIIVNRIGGKYGNCTDSSKSRRDVNLFEEWFPETSYSTISCFKTCYQKYVIKRCGCADPMYPMTGKALGVKNMTACDARDVTQDDCVYGVTLDYIRGKLDCSCFNPCKEKWYEYFPSKSMWPSEAEQETFLEVYADSILSYENFTNHPEFFRRNYLVIEVFLESLQQKHLNEVPKYKIEKYIADIGGTVGLWIGLTILALAELLELLMDMLVLLCSKLLNRQRSKENTLITEMEPKKEGSEDDFGSIVTPAGYQIRHNTTSHAVMDVNVVHWD